ncbi:type VI secretion system baseplate subunit TssE [Massilia sp. IC2-477]|uniref:type VI secretion system baseplate subunit TssE n=1 Tax=Massilia sp. IC2-477 TaxID=2887198 RepID=UPI001D124644|nr:type VI secretion system baseplate subunit TssE [Massilia sp. IC2-477]MCC2955226.1 type VI secretion system baseplate subunit TssE [Massilia sp. IC2-477]
MKGIKPGLLDRLMDERPEASAGSACTSEQLKDSVARDLEALLNTRLAFDPAILNAYPEARGSLLHYGLADFAGYCLTSSIDRAAVCASIQDAIEAHEPRLREVSATLDLAPGSVNRLSFIIHARLALPDCAEPVHFNAVLQPSSLHYAVKRNVRQRS